MRRKPFLACLRCRFLVVRPRETKSEEKKEVRCPNCGSTELTENWEGMIILLKADSELIKHVEYLTGPGRYAVEVGRE